MKVIQCYTQGGKHIKLNKPCEDRTYSMHKNGVSVISLADGAGSDKYAYSAQGAECITKTVAEFFCNNFEKFYDNKDEDELKRILIYVCLKQLKLFAKENDIDDVRKMASTLLCVAVKDSKSIICHLGDGVIGKLTKDGTYVVSLPENGEFANCTYFVTSNEAVKHLRIIKSTNKDVTGYFLMSDGVADYVFDDASQTFYDSARKLTLLVTEEDCEEKLAKTLDRFIISVDSNSDDCSFTAMIIEESSGHIDSDMLNVFVEDTKETNIAINKKEKKHNFDLKKTIVIASAIVLVMAILLTIIGIKTFVEKGNETTSPTITTLIQESTTATQETTTKIDDSSIETDNETSNNTTEKNKFSKDETNENIKNNIKTQDNQKKKGDYNVR